jgi:hypothetical protein
MGDVRFRSQLGLLKFSVLKLYRISDSVKEITTFVTKAVIKQQLKSS